MIYFASSTFNCSVLDKVTIHAFQNQSIATDRRFLLISNLYDLDNS